MTLFVAFFLIFSYFFLIRPLQHDFARARERRIQEEYYLFQLKRVREHYPTLHDLSYEEIRERYNVREAFYSIR